MLNIHDTASKAASEFGLSMKDDPTLWPEGEPITAEAVRKACNASALENARTALARSLGKIAETVATDMDVALAEDGPLADLDAVLAQHVEDGPEIDLSGVAAAADWDARVEALREAFGVAVQGYHLPPLPIIDLMAYVGSDPRLDGEVMRTVAALTGPEHARPDVPAALTLAGSWDDEDEPDAVDPWADEEPDPVARERGKASPGRKRRTKAEIAEDEAADRAEIKPGAICSQDDADAVMAKMAADNGWDDEDAPVVATAPNLPGLTGAAGIADMDMAAILGIAKGYYSLIRNGKRPWPGLKPDQVQRLRVELAARREALDAIGQALTTDTVLKPEGV